MSSKILFSEEKYSNKSIGLIELNHAKGLNALDTAMYKSMRAKLEEWVDDDEIGAVIIHSQVQKAFCAGGDVKEVVLKLQENDLTEAKEFFTEEYTFDHYLRQYPKPVIGFAHGYTMGGGLGLLQACHVRIATDQSLMAMPEISIGFFCDVGASEFLPKLPGKLGLFLGLTAGKISGRAALKLQLCDQLFKLSEKPKVLSELLKLQFFGEKEKDLERINFVLQNLNSEANKESAILDQLEIVNKICSGDIVEIDKNFRAFVEAHSEDSWIKECIKTYMLGSPLAATIIYELLTKHNSSNVKLALEQEWVLARNFCDFSSSAGKDFNEGIRALLVDKDRNFNWSFKTVEEAKKKGSRKLLSTPFWGEKLIS